MRWRGHGSSARRVLMKLPHVQLDLTGDHAWVHVGAQTVSLEALAALSPSMLNVLEQLARAENGKTFQVKRTGNEIEIVTLGEFGRPRFPVTEQITGSNPVGTANRGEAQSGLAQQSPKLPSAGSNPATPAKGGHGIAVVPWASNPMTRVRFTLSAPSDLSSARQSVCLPSTRSWVQIPQVAPILSVGRAFNSLTALQIGEECQS